MFPTTIWTTIREAGGEDRAALERFASDYRGPVLRYVRSRGHSEIDAEDICQDVFVRLLGGKVLSRALSDRGRFRSLLLSVVFHVIADRERRRKDLPVESLEIVNMDPDFDREWMLELTERALRTLREQGSPYYGVLRGHLSGNPMNRNKLWIARQKLAHQVRREIANTCSSQAELDEEVAYLSRFLRPGKKM